jgi:hypothetical protein
LVVLADVHQPDEAALPATSKRKCATSKCAIELSVIFLAGDLPPALPIRRRFDEPRFQMIQARMITI